MIIINIKSKRRICDAFFFVMTPYAVIIALNNLLMVNLGFSKISQTVIWLHVGVMIAFYLGTKLIKCPKKTSGKNNFSGKNTQYAKQFINILHLYIVICLILVIFDYLSLVSQFGVVGFITSGDKIEHGFLANHATVALNPLGIVCLDVYFKNKDKFSLFLFVVASLCIFMTFIKYHIMVFLVALLFFGIIHNGRSFKKAGTICLVAVLLFFVANYAISFMAAGESPDGMFYVKHLWGYLAGGTVNIDNAMKSFANSENLDFGKWIVQLMFALPDMFNKKLFGAGVSNYNFSLMVPTYNIGAENSNVLSVIGTVYIQSNIIVLFVFFFVFGIISQKMYKNILVTKSLGVIIASCIVLSFNFFSFFACFYELEQPWETIVQALIWGALLKIRFRKSKVATIAYNKNKKV